jgi:hypothetical protein
MYTCNICNVNIIIPLCLLFSTTQVESKRVFLDNGGFNYHAEVFYSVANLVVTKILPKEPNITFVVDRNFAKVTDLISFWDKYWNSSELYSLGHKYEFKWQKSILRKCEKADNVTNEFALVVFVTQPISESFVKCLSNYQNNSKFLNIVHHPESHSPLAQIVHWNNTYVASDNEKILNLTPRHFSPSLMPLSVSTPNCQKNPIFIVQGGLESYRRNLEELKWYLDMSDKYKFTVRIMTRSPYPNITDTYHRIEHLQHQPMVKFHEGFLDGAVLLPLISPDFGPTRHYFQGHPTSNIAYASHFNLRVVGHRGILNSYKYELRNNIGYWHNGTKESAIVAAIKSVYDFGEWCTSKLQNNSKRLWGEKGKSLQVRKDIL